MKNRVEFKEKIKNRVEFKEKMNGWG